MHRSPFQTTFFSNLPTIIRRTLFTLLCVNGLSFLLSALFVHIFHWPSPYKLLSLSAWGISHGMLWQLLSYLFLFPFSHQTTMSALFLIVLHVYLLRSLGSAIVHARGQRHFIGLYFGGGLFIGLLAYLFLASNHLPFALAGARYSINILLMAWTFLFADATVVVFFLFPMRAKWAALGFIGFQFFVDFSSGHFFAVTLDLAALFYGYFYPLLIWKTPGPFRRLHPFERRLIAWAQQHGRYPRKKRRKKGTQAAIYSIETGEEIARERAFVDACLDKISARGKKSLSWRERWRLKHISRKTQRK